VIDYLRQILTEAVKQIIARHTGLRHKRVDLVGSEGASQIVRRGSGGLGDLLKGGLGGLLAGGAAGSVLSGGLNDLLKQFSAERPHRYRQLVGRYRAKQDHSGLVDSGFDLAIRFGPLYDSSLIARVLAPDHRVICGAPTYLEQRGRPQTTEGVLSHDCIIYGSPLLNHWTFADGSSVRLGGALITNDGDLAHVWALEGAGLVVKSIWDDVDAGRLEVVLPQLRLPASPIHAVYPHSRLAAAEVHLCVNFLAAKMKFAGRIGPRQDQYVG
jgi:DNA-binding transcriptional LysR family regulator